MVRWYCFVLILFWPLKPASVADASEGESMGAVLRAGRIFTLCRLCYFDILPACRRLRPGLALSALRSKFGEVFADDALCRLFADHGDSVQ